MDMNTMLKFAFASTDMKHVDQHFGSAQGFALYGVDMDKSELLEVVQFSDTAQDGNENKLIDKMAALEGCAAVYCQAVGGSAIRQLTMQGVQPIKVSAGAEIAELIENIQDELRAGPTAWLAKALHRQQPKNTSRFDDMEAEGWSE
jgi:nitrogen fixation protein NifX